MGKDLKGKELGTGIHQRKNGRYEGRYIDRFGKRKSIYSLKLSDLRTELAIKIAENQMHVSIRSEIKLDIWFEKWLDIYKKRSVRPNTLREYMLVYRKNISPYIGGYKINSLVKSNIQEVIDKASDVGYGYERQNKIRMILSDMFSRACEDELMVKNPAHGVLLRAKKDEESRFLTLDEQENFFETCAGTFYNNLFNVAVHTGLRPGELFALTAEDINMDEKYIDVNKTLVYQAYPGEEHKTFHIEEPKTPKSKRKVPMNCECIRYMQKQLRQKEIIASKSPKEQTEFIFTTKFNTPLNSSIASDAIKKLCVINNSFQAADDEIEPFGMHALRHTFATRCFEAGISPKVVQSYLGHATLQMTMDLYTHVMKERAYDDIEKIVDMPYRENNIIEFYRKNVV